MVGEVRQADAFAAECKEFTINVSNDHIGSFQRDLLHRTWRDIVGTRDRGELYCHR